MSLNICIGAWCSGKTTTIRALQARDRACLAEYMYEDQRIPNSLLQKFGTKIEPNCDSIWLAERTKMADKLWCDMFMTDFKMRDHSKQIYVDYYPLAGTLYFKAIQYYKGLISLSDATEDLSDAMCTFMKEKCNYHRPIIYKYTGCPRENNRERKFDLDGNWLQAALDSIGRLAAD